MNNITFWHRGPGRKGSDRPGPASAFPQPRMAHPATALLRGGALPAALAGGAVAAGSAFAGGRAAAGAGLGAVLVLVAMSIGPLVMQRSQEWSPPAVMGIALISYGAVVTVLGVVYVALGSAGWLSGGHLGVALIAGCLAWTAGELRAAWRLRALAFADTRPPSGGSSAGS